MTSNKTLQTLEIGNNNFGDRAAQSIGMYLDASRHRLPEPCAQYWSSSARGVGTVRATSQSSLTDDGHPYCLTGKMLKTNDTIEGLSMWKNNILAAGAKYGQSRCTYAHARCLSMFESFFEKLVVDV